MDRPGEFQATYQTRLDLSDWPLDAGCWLLRHFQRIKKRSRAPEGEGSAFDALAVHGNRAGLTAGRGIMYNTRKQQKEEVEIKCQFS